MKKTTKKLVSLLLTLVLALSVSSISAFAKTPTNFDVIRTDTEWIGVDDALNAMAGDTITVKNNKVTDNYLINSRVIDDEGETVLGYNPTFKGQYRVITIPEGYDVSSISEIDSMEGGVIKMVEIYIAPHVHANRTTMVPMKAPTMTEDGCKLYYECACGKFFTDSAATTEIADIDAWKTSDTMGLIHKLSYNPAPEKKEEAKKDDKKTSPATGATMGLGALGLGVALLAVLKKKED